MSLNQKVVLICGGGKNLGALIARIFAADGAQLAIHYNSAKTKPAAEELLKELSQKYPKSNVALYQGDLTVVKNIQDLFENVVKRFGRVDIVINTVGMVLKKPLADVTEEEYDAMFAINSKSAFFITQEAARRVTDGGKIINTVTALLAAYCPGYSSYQGSKAPVEWFTKALSKELMGRGVSVNSVAPGPMDTPFFYGQESPDSVEYHKSNAIGGRLTDIEDIASIYKFLCTDGAWFNGQTLFANGGYTSR